MSSISATSGWSSDISASDSGIWSSNDSVRSTRRNRENARGTRSSIDNVRGTGRSSSSGNTVENLDMTWPQFSRDLPSRHPSSRHPKRPPTSLPWDSVVNMDPLDMQSELHRSYKDLPKDKQRPSAERRKTAMKLEGDQTNFRTTIMDEYRYIPSTSYINPKSNSRKPVKDNLLFSQEVRSRRTLTSEVENEIPEIVPSFLPPNFHTKGEKKQQADKQSTKQEVDKPPIKSSSPYQRSSSSVGVQVVDLSRSYVGLKTASSINFTETPPSFRRANIITDRNQNWTLG